MSLLLLSSLLPFLFVNAASVVFVDVVNVAVVPTALRIAVLLKYERIFKL